MEIKARGYVVQHDGVTGQRNMTPIVLVRCSTLDKATTAMKKCRVGAYIYHALSGLRLRDFDGVLLWHDAYGRERLPPR